MIDKILFSDYKAFTTDEEGLPNCLELRPITLLLGKNSSGKSSLIKLLEMLSQSLSGKDAQPIEGDLGLFHNFLRSNALHLEVHSDANQTNLIAEYISDKGQFFPIKVKVNDKVLVSAPKEDIPNQSLSAYLSEAGLPPDSLQFSLNHIGPWRQCLEDSLFNPKTTKADPAYATLVDSYKNGTELYPQVQAWMGSDAMESHPIEIKLMPDSKLYQFRVNHNGVNVNIDEVGTGVSQVLPIIVQSFNPDAADVVAVEQPVLHLHPAAHAAVARRLAESAKTFHRRYVIESHSQNFLLGLRLAVADKDFDFTPDDIVIYFLDTNREGSQLVKITVDSNGQLSYWPYGVFGEHADLTRNIIKIAGGNR